MQKNRHRHLNPGSVSLVQPALSLRKKTPPNELLHEQMKNLDSSPSAIGGAVKGDEKKELLSVQEEVLHLVDELKRANDKRNGAYHALCELGVKFEGGRPVAHSSNLDRDVKYQTEYHLTAAMSIITASEGLEKARLSKVRAILSEATRSIEENTGKMYGRQASGVIRKLKAAGGKDEKEVTLRLNACIDAAANALARGDTATALNKLSVA